jgi:hypothetical protein
MRKYCVEIERELEETMTHHFTHEGEPTRDEVLEIVDELDCGYDDKYGRITYYEVFKGA